MQIYFLLVRIKIKHMEMAIIRRETAGTGSNQYNESETITKYEVMDGAPAKGELCIAATCPRTDVLTLSLHRYANSLLSFGASVHRQAPVRSVHDCCADVRLLFCVLMKSC